MNSSLKHIIYRTRTVEMVLENKNKYFNKHPHGHSTILIMGLNDLMAFAPVQYSSSSSSAQLGVCGPV